MVITRPEWIATTISSRLGLPSFRACQVCESECRTLGSVLLRLGYVQPVLQLYKRHLVFDGP
jgi:hypothetical protein